MTLGIEVVELLGLLVEQNAVMNDLLAKQLRIAELSVEEAETPARIGTPFENLAHIEKSKGGTESGGR